VQWIVAGCDVFVSNLRPGSLNRLRLGYPDIAAARPDVIYCQAHGFPSDSSQADAPAFDDIIQAASGVPDVLRRAGGTSGLMPTLLADKVCGLVLTYSIIAALPCSTSRKARIASVIGTSTCWPSPVRSRWKSAAMIE